MRLLGDTSAWLPIWDHREQENAAMRRHLEALTRQNATVLITDYIFDETLTLINVRAGHALAVRAGRWLLTSVNVRMLRITQEQWQAAWQMFQQYDDRQFSFTDCTSFVMMRELHLVDAFTFDRHFEQMGFRMWPR
jgi:predicted nucleic acid-binding protein